METLGIWLYLPVKRAIHGYGHGHIDVQVGSDLYWFDARQDAPAKPVGATQAEARFRGQLRTCSIGERALMAKSEMNSRRDAGFDVPQIRVRRLTRQVPHEVASTIRRVLAEYESRNLVFCPTSPRGTYNCGTLAVDWLERSGLVRKGLLDRKSDPYFFMPEHVFESLEHFEMDQLPFFESDGLELAEDGWVATAKNQPSKSD